MNKNETIKKTEKILNTLSIIIDGCGFNLDFDKEDEIEAIEDFKQLLNSDDIDKQELESYCSDLNKTINKLKKIWSD